VSGVLPPAPDAATFEAIPRDDPRLLEGAVVVARRAGLPGDRVARFPEGSLPVYAVGDSGVLKLYPPCYAFEEAIETSALRAIEGRVGIPTPRVLATGEADGWRWLAMSRLEGESLARAWPRISAADRARLVESLGRSLALLHACPSDGLAVPRPDWATFVREQSASASTRQRARGLPEAWVERIPDFLDRETAPARPDGAPVLLHTEVMREHLLVRESSGGFLLSGLVDFEPAMVGAAEYEFASVGVFVTGGEAGLLRRLLVAYGSPERDLGPALSRRFLAYALLHRYANLPWYLRRVPPPEGARTLDDLAQAWFGLS
jgi:hygromycin-B 7''-O-kinase